MARSRIWLLAALAGLASVGNVQAQQKPKAYNLPATDLKQQVIWGATCDGPNGTGLAFGGQDQKADDGVAHTRIKVDGKWLDISEELRKNNPLQKQHDEARALARQLREVAALNRRIYFAGHAADKELELIRADAVAQYKKVADPWRRLLVGLGEAAKTATGYPKQQADRAVSLLGASFTDFSDATKQLAGKGTGLPAFGLHAKAVQGVEQAAEALGAEPPPRALSPIVYDDKSKLYVLFGGDHLDYLMNDTWVFDPAKKTWEVRPPKEAPPPRGNHALKAAGDGKIVLSGGYTYTSSTDYVGGQYRDIGDGDWTYDIAANTWTGKEKGVGPNQRVYRTGPFHPDFFLQGEKPDAAVFQKKLQDLPANTWVSTKPPHLPRLNRDWGTAVLDPDQDLILRWSGGHSAHGGSDVLHYHLASNRWELPFPVEFPLGQLYSNTSYPNGFNFNMRPWITGHTYQNYGYDPALKKMLFTGRPNHCYIWDPDVADWTGRFAKPKGMVYDSCFYTLTLTPTPRGLYCWTQTGLMFRFDAARKDWLAVELKGEKLPGSVVDNSTVVHDSKRDRLLFFRKGYGDKAAYDGQIHALDLKTGEVSRLNPQGMEAAAAIPYLCQIRYDAVNDLLLVGATLSPGDDALRRTPAYDCAKNEWLSLKLAGDDPSGKAGRNVSLGLMFDAKRKLFWAVDTNSNVFVLRLDPKSADPQPLK
jgi:hypothetical protein